jgi:hypothetical protein
MCFSVQTILCRDCKELYDAVTRLRVAEESGGVGGLAGFGKARPIKTSPVITAPPSFQAVLNRLPLKGVTRSKWLLFKLRCPVSALHRVRSWNDPDQCPKCGIFLEKSALPYRLWD